MTVPAADDFEEIRKNLERLRKEGQLPAHPEKGPDGSPTPPAVADIPPTWDPYYCFDEGGDLLPRPRPVTLPLVWPEHAKMLVVKTAKEGRW